MEGIIYLANTCVSDGVRYSVFTVADRLLCIYQLAGYHPGGLLGKAVEKAGGGLGEESSRRPNQNSTSCFWNVVYYLNVFIGEGIGLSDLITVGLDLRLRQNNSREKQREVGYT